MLLLPYFLDKQLLLYTYNNRFVEIFPWPNFVQANCTSDSDMPIDMTGEDLLAFRVMEILKDESILKRMKEILFLKN